MAAGLIAQATETGDMDPPFCLGSTTVGQTGQPLTNLRGGKMNNAEIVASIDALTAAVSDFQTVFAVFGGLFVILLLLTVQVFRRVS